MVAQEGLVDKVALEQKPEDKGVDHTSSGVKSMTSRGTRKFKDSEVGAHATGLQPTVDTSHQLGPVT